MLCLEKVEEPCHQDSNKLKTFAKEILNDWDAMVAFVKNSQLPASNNEAERGSENGSDLQKKGLNRYLKCWHFLKILNGKLPFCIWFSGSGEEAG